MTSQLPHSADFVVVGGGVVGLTIALRLRERHPKASIVVLEKEAHCGEHASGRNSGVIHAGFYYTADSLKATLTRDGNRRLHAWCEEHGVAVRRCGKLVVARNAADLPGLDELLRRARHNDVELEDLDEEDAHRIEPRARTFRRALYSPSTAAVDPVEVMRALAELARRTDIEVATRCVWLGTQGRKTLTSSGVIEPGYLVNAAGLHADRVARAYGFAKHYRMLPFKGLYLYAKPGTPQLRTHIYPVPDLGMPFLGVHFTVTTGGRVKIGPTAMPSLWLENYGGVGSGKFFERFNVRELAGVLGRSTRMLLGDRTFRRHARGELGKMFRTRLVKHAAALCRDVDASHFDSWGRPGIRAQLYDTKKGELEMDFRYEGDDRSMHVLNAVSPAFTCALSFAELIVDDIEKT
jgi:L-2-hydroxyglutarate oxidase LhgO